MGTQLRNPPVYFTVAQVRFNPILKLADFLATIQETLRNEGFPDFAPQPTIVLKVINQDGQSMPMASPQLRYSFGNIEKTHSFLLEDDKLTFQSSNYGEYETFSATFLKTLSIVNDVVRLDFTDRIGLRYLDRISPRGTDTLSQYLVPEALGMSARLSGKAERSFTEALNQVNEIKLLSRVITLTGGLGFPPDLAPVGMIVSSRFTEHVGLHAILDNDGFFEGREAYSIATIQAHLDSIHKVIGDAFRSTATPHAFTTWDLP